MGKTIKEGLYVMTNEPDLSTVIPWSEYLEQHQQTSDMASASEMRKRAMEFVRSHKWCRSVERVYVGFIHPDIVAVFLFLIDPSEPGVDEWIWVVVGDLPPAYVASDECPTPATALDGYIGAMDDWVNAVEDGRSVDDLIPVNAPPTKEFAHRLNTRLDFLHQQILPLHQ